MENKFFFAPDRSLPKELPISTNVVQPQKTIQAIQVNKIQVNNNKIKAKRVGNSILEKIYIFLKVSFYILLPITIFLYIHLFLGLGIIPF